MAVPSDVWVVDETVIKVGGDNLWFWDIIDEDTRFLLGSHLSRKRTIADVVAVMSRAKDHTDSPPRMILSDGLAAYPDGIERVFGADALHIRSKGFTSELNTNLIERFHGTIKQRTKVVRGFKTPETASLILQGFLTGCRLLVCRNSINDVKLVCSVPSMGLKAGESCALRSSPVDRRWRRSMGREKTVCELAASAATAA